MNFKTKNDAITTMKWTREVASIGGAVTGITVMWSMAYTSMYAATGSVFFSSLVAIIFICVGLFVIDYSYRRNFPFVADLIVSGQAFKNWRIFLFTFLLLGFAGVQMFSSGYLSWEGRKDVAEALMDAPDLADVASVKVSADKSTSSKIREVKSQIAIIDRDIAAKEKEVESLYPSYRQKIKSGQDKWGWHAGQLTKLKDKATADLRRQKNDLSANLSELVGRQSATDSMVVASVIAQDNFKLSEFVGKKSRNMNILGFFGVGCLAIVALISILLSLVGQSDVEEVDMKETRRPFRQDAPTKSPTSAPRHAVAPPHLTPVNAGVSDSYELKRRQEMLEARIEQERREREEEAARKAEEQSMRIAEMRRQEQEAKQKLSEELARQKAEAARQIAEMQAAADKTTSPPPPTKKAKSLSDKQSGKLSVNSADKIEVVGNGVSVGGELYTFDKLAKFVDLAQKWYNRQFTSATPSAKAKNADKWRQAEKALKAIGCKISKAGEKVSIDTSELKVS